jgi:AmmeMemoRadiSam system protein B
MFYPGQSAVLAREVAQLIAARPHAGDAPKALICPHAGYVYSGRTAGRAYAWLADAADAIRRVVLLGPCHRVAINGVAIPSAEAMATPLGEVPIDEAARRTPGLQVSDAAHAAEHSLEVQLPFLQSVLKEFSVIPLAVGHASPEQVAEILDHLWGGPETLIVVSSDLSHYLPYRDAQAVDTATTRKILALEPPLHHQQACGATPINGLLLAAKRRGLRPQLIELCNSGDTAGDRSRVVGYAAIAFQEGADDPSGNQ